MGKEGGNPLILSPKLSPLTLQLATEISCGTGVSTNGLGRLKCGGA